MALERLDSSVQRGVCFALLAYFSWSSAPIAFEERHNAERRGMHAALMIMSMALNGAQKLPMTLPDSFFSRSKSHTLLKFFVLWTHARNCKNAILDALL